MTTQTIEITGGIRGQQPRTIQLALPAPLERESLTRLLMEASADLQVHLGGFTFGHDVVFNQDAAPTAEGAIGTIAARSIDAKFETGSVMLGPSACAQFRILLPEPEEIPPAPVQRDSIGVTLLAAVSVNGVREYEPLRTDREPAQMDVLDLLAVLFRLAHAVHFVPAADGASGFGVLHMRAGDRTIALGPAQFDAHALRSLGVA